MTQRVLKSPHDDLHRCHGARRGRRAWAYRWLSAAAHAGAGSMSGLLDQEAWRELADGLDWKVWLTEAEDALGASSMRLITHTGQPLATDSFLSKLEAFLGRRLRPLPVGRARKVRRASEK